MYWNAGEASAAGAAASGLIETWDVLKYLNRIGIGGQ